MAEMQKLISGIAWMTKFKEKNRDLQELVREFLVLKSHNKSFKPGDSQKSLLLFAEGALILLVLERFLRILPGVGATKDDTLTNLLEKAASKKRDLLKISKDDIKSLKDFRNAILHGNFEQAAKNARCKDVPEYFKKNYIRDVEYISDIVNELVDQINPNTGHPKKR